MEDIMDAQNFNFVFEFLQNGNFYLQSLFLEEFFDEKKIFQQAKI